MSTRVSHSFVFKLKCLAGPRDDTRRYGFTGDLARPEVFTGLYDRTSQVFGLAPGSFHLEFTSSAGKAVRLDDFDTFKREVVDSTVSPDGLVNAKVDEKQRIVLHFNIKSNDRAPAAESVQSAAAAAHDAAAKMKAEIEAIVAQSRKLALDGSTPMPAQAEPLAAATAATKSLAFPPPESSSYSWNWSVPPPPPSVPLESLQSLCSGSNPSHAGVHRHAHGAANGTSTAAARAATLKRQMLAAKEKRAQSQSHSTCAKPAQAAPVDGWAKTKSILTTFVRDLNKHLADNFGDDAHGFALALDDHQPVEVKTPAASPASKVFHPGVYCDGCLRGIVGIRYRSLRETNFDLCEACRGSASADHQFEAITTPVAFGAVHGVARAMNLAREAALAVQRKAKVELEHPANCDLCERTIKGVRHKCLNCPDYDLCAGCFKSVDVHHPNHNFIAVSDPNELKLKAIPSQLVAHRGIVCDTCGVSPIVGPRYKCADKACDDFDMCGSCVSDPIARHPPSHHLLMIREPAQARQTQASVTRARQVEEVASLSSLLRSIGRGSPSKANAPESVPVSAQLVDGPGQDKTLVVDVDVGECAASLPREIHVPICGPVPESVTIPVEAVTVTEAASEGYPAEVLIAEAEEVVEAEKLDAKFIDDVTLADGSVVPAGGMFNKVWSVANSGNRAWPVGTRLTNVGGFSSLAGRERLSFEVPSAAVGETVDVQAELKAPEDDGIASDFWRLQAPNGKLFGNRFWVSIKVESDHSDAVRGSASSLSSSIVAPSINAAGKTQSIAPSTANSQTATTAPSELASIPASDSHAEFDLSSDEADELSSDEDDDIDDSSSESSAESDYIVLSDGHRDESDDEDYAAVIA